MKFRAKVNLLGEEGQKSAAYLVKAFFEDFKPENSIFINDGKAILEIYFEKENLPIAIIDAIGDCKLKEFEYNKKSQELGQKETFEQAAQKEETKTSQNTEVIHQGKNEKKESKRFGIVARGYKDLEVVPVTLKEEKSSKKVNSEVEEENILIQNEEEIKSSEIITEPEQVKKEEKTSEQIKTVVVKELPELTEIAKKCSSYEEFVNKLTKSIDFGKKNEFFVKLVNAATQTEDIKWDNIKEVFKNNNLEYSESNKVFCTARVTEKFSRIRNPVKILELIKIIVTYQAFDFHKENEEHEDKNQEKVWFSDLLGTINETHDLNTRIMNMLNVMGLDNVQSEEKDKITAIVYVAINEKTSDLDFVFEKANISKNDRLNYRVVVGTFVNKYLETIGYGEKIKVAKFLEDLINILV